MGVGCVSFFIIFHDDTVDGQNGSPVDRYSQVFSSSTGGSDSITMVPHLVGWYLNALSEEVS